MSPNDGKEKRSLFNINYIHDTSTKVIWTVSSVYSCTHIITTSVNSSNNSHLTLCHIRMSLEITNFQD